MSHTPEPPENGPENPDRPVNDQAASGEPGRLSGADDSRIKHGTDRVF